MRNAWALGMLAVLFCVGWGKVRADEPRWFDGMDDPAPWKVITADGVKLATASDAGVAGSALRLDYDFSRGSGYGIIRREFSPALEVPENYRFTFDIRGAGPRNTLELKLVEKDGAGGESVWWVNQRDYAFPAEWQRVMLPKRRFTFAWGPSGGTPLKRIDAIEIVVTSFNGGSGSLWIDDLRLEAMPAVKAYDGSPRVTVSSRADGHADEPLAINAEGFLGWRSADGNTDAAPTATIDFGEPREFGGLVIRWGAGAGASDYEVEAAEGSEWKRLATVIGGNGGSDYLVTPDALAQSIRIRTVRPQSANGVDLLSVRVLPPEFAESPDELFKVMAADAPRGWFPRYWLGEGTYWNVIGADFDANEALIGEDGAIELGKQGPSLEPFIHSGGRLLTWNEMPSTHRLDEGYLPIPSAIREISTRGGEVGLRLEVMGVVDDAPPVQRGRGFLLVRYRLTNIGTASHPGTLFIAARPIQVNPTYQFLNTPGGAAAVHTIRAADAGLWLDERRVECWPHPSAVGACTIAQGEVVEHLAMGRVPTPAASQTSDPAGFASGAMAFPFDLAPGASMEIHVGVPLHADPAVPASATVLNDGAGPEFFDARVAAASRQWSERLNRVQITLPPRARRWWDSTRSNLAYILINRDGPGIQPGSRSYERTWIRDGSLTSSAMLAFGLTDEVREFLDWFAPFQYDDGKIPCCVDRRGPDPVPEHDSHGQYIYAVMNDYRYTGDAAFLRRHWDRVVKAVAYMEVLRQTRMTDEFRDGPDDKRVLYGLLPESISHEGYSAKPMHSYWDDLWALKGLEDAAEMALVLREEAQASRIAGLRDSFRGTLMDSITLAMKLKRIDYIPGCAELGDFDATSTTIGVWPCDQRGVMPEPALTHTFDRYWKFFTDRRDAIGDQASWVNYTPYEWRTVGTMVRLGQRQRAHEIADFFFKDSRPGGWNHWAEVVWRDPRHAGFIGDMPHTWVGSDFINSFRSMIAYENDRDRSMVIGAGLPLDWLLADEGVTVRGLRTHFGELGLSIRRDGSPTRIKFELAAGLRMPEGGLFVSLPEADLVRSVRVDGEAAARDGGMVKVPRVPATIVVDYAPAR